MYLCGGDGANASNVFKWFLIILTISSFVFALIGLNAGHHHPESVHEGDAIRWYSILVILTWNRIHCSVYLQEELRLGLLQYWHNHRSQRITSKYHLGSDTFRRPCVASSVPDIGSCRSAIFVRWIVRNVSRVRGWGEGVSILGTNQWTIPTIGSNTTNGNEFTRKIQIERRLMLIDANWRAANINWLSKQVFIFKFKIRIATNVRRNVITIFNIRMMSVCVCVCDLCLFFLRLILCCSRWTSPNQTQMAGAGLAEHRTWPKHHHQTRLLSSEERKKIAESECCELCVRWLLQRLLGRKNGWTQKRRNENRIYNDIYLRLQTTTEQRYNLFGNAQQAHSTVLNVEYFESNLGENSRILCERDKERLVENNKMVATQRESKITNVPPMFTTLPVKDGWK